MVCLLTGASSGIGRSLAFRLAAAGDTLALVARREPLLCGLADEINAAGGHAVAFACDVTDRPAVASVIRRVENELGVIDRLIANAGGGRRTRVETFDAGDIEAMLDLNTLGVAHCVESVLPGMIERGAGHLVAIASLAGWRGLPGAAGYSSAKAATIAMMESLRIDLKPLGVDVTVVSPGFVQVKADTKRRPFQMELEDATAHIFRAIEQRKRSSAFPLPLVVAAAAGRCMPAAAFDMLFRRKRKASG